MGAASSVNPPAQKMMQFATDFTSFSEFGSIL
jgi:hypothetical protein